MKFTASELKQIADAMRVEFASNTADWIRRAALARASEVLASSQAYEEIASLIDRVSEIERRLPSEE